MKRNASAHWEGNLKEGHGSLSTESQVLKEIPYSFSTRFENEKGTNPEELIAAAHAGCFSMSLSNELAQMNLKVEAIDTKARVQMEKTAEGFTVTAVHLTVTGQVPNASEDQFRKAAETAKAGCPISRLLKANISLEAQLAHAPASKAMEANY
ncbi:MAG: OsmC family protein [Pseudobdellovibrionaceae bacterium]